MQSLLDKDPLLALASVLSRAWLVLTMRLPGLSQAVWRSGFGNEVGFGSEVRSGNEVKAL